MQPTPTPSESWINWLLYGSLRESSRQRTTVLVVLAVMVLLGGPFGIGAALLAAVAVAAVRVGVRQATGSLEELGSVLDAVEGEDQT